MDAEVGGQFRDQVHQFNFALSLPSVIIYLRSRLSARRATPGYIAASLAGRIR